MARPKKVTTKKRRGRPPKSASKTADPVKTVTTVISKKPVPKTTKRFRVTFICDTVGPVTAEDINSERVECPACHEKFIYDHESHVLKNTKTHSLRQVVEF